MKRFSLSKPSSGIWDGETSIARMMMDVLIKHNNRGERKNIYTKKDHITIQSTFFLQKSIIWLAQAMTFKCMELLEDTKNWKMIKAKNLPKYSREKRKEKKRKQKKKEEKNKEKWAKIYIYIYIYK